MKRTLLTETMFLKWQRESQRNNNIETHDFAHQFESMVVEAIKNDSDPEEENGKEFKENF